MGDLHNLAALVETPRLALIVVLSAAIKQASSVMYQRAVAVRAPLAAFGALREVSCGHDGRTLACELAEAPGAVTHLGVHTLGP